MTENTIRDHTAVYAVVFFMANVLFVVFGGERVFPESLCNGVLI